MADSRSSRLAASTRVSASIAARAPNQMATSTSIKDMQYSSIPSNISHRIASKRLSITDDLSALAANFAPSNALPEESIAPPEISAEQTLKGGHALRKLKQYCDQMHKINQQYVQEHTHACLIINQLMSEKQNLTAELQDKNDKIARLKQKLFIDNRFTRTQEEAERLLLEETRKRINTERENAAYQASIEKCMQEYSAYRASVRYEESQRESREQLIKDQTNTISELNQEIVTLNYRIDELKVTKIKYERKTDDLEKNILGINQRNEYLSQSEVVLREENAQLQKRLRELLDANKEVTANYQIVKKNHDIKRREYEEVSIELEEAKNACQVALRNKRQQQNEVASLQKIKTETQDRLKAVEAVLVRKEKDIADLLNKINETISEYELKLERKEEQMWAMSMQLSEETQKSHAAQQASNAKQKTHAFAVDTDVINDIEKRWQAKEKSLMDEIDRLMSEIHVRDDKISDLGDQISALTKRQFHPRMERLKTIEQDIKNRMEEYALAEERMETGFICPRDLKIFKVPMTLVPCGHTYCKTCLEAIREENYSIVKCPTCATVAHDTYRNEQVETISEQFTRRKHLTLSFLDWIKTLKVYLPSDESDP